MRIDEPFRSPCCGRYLYVSRWYSQFLFWTTVVISILLCYGLGFRGSSLFFASFIGTIPIFFVVAIWAINSAPPKLRECAPDYEPPNFSGPLGLNRQKRQ